MKRFDTGDMPDDEFTITTWHDNEPLEQAVWFAKASAHHPTLEVAGYRLLIAGRDRSLADVFADER